MHVFYSIPNKNASETNKPFLFISLVLNGFDYAHIYLQSFHDDAVFIPIIWDLSIYLSNVFNHLAHSSARTAISFM